MNKSLQYILGICLLLFAFVACQKETSFEFGPNPIASYSFLDATGNCASNTINGFFQMDSVLTDSNYVVINVQFNSVGKYLISSDTLNGMWFVDSGFVTTTGPKQIKLKGAGTPILPITNGFVLNQNTNGCGFSITVLPADNYLPKTLSSTWSFQYKPALIGSSGNIDSFAVIVSLSSITNNGKDYAEFATTLGDNYYFAKEGVYNYWEYGYPDFDYAGIFDKVDDFVEYIYLKANQPAGSTWESPAIGATYGAAFGLTPIVGTTKSVFTVINAKKPYTIAGKTFSNVITVKRDIMFKPTGGTYVKLMDGTAMYAKDIGLIDQIINLPGGGTENIPILRWDIK
jgi:hypothetical protein